MTLVISNCSKRKRVPLDSSLRARDLDSGDTADVAAQWTRRLKAAPMAALAKDLYGGRAFVEAARAAKRADAKLLIVSAGLGLIEYEAQVPAYGLTTVRRDPDCILDKTGEGARAWWSALQRASPLQTSALDAEAGLILAALPGAYLTMIADDWSTWPQERLARLRLFTKEEPQAGSAAFRSAWMPYDDRLDSVEASHEGTQGDFAQRALGHFVSSIVGTAIDVDRQGVLAALDGLSPRHVPVRKRLSDTEIMAIIDADWTLVGGRSSAMLRRLRDDLVVACEQRRFQGLFKTVADRRAEGVLL